MNSDKLFYGIVTIVTILIFVGILFVASNSSNNETTNTSQVNVSAEELIGENPITSANTEEAEVVIVEFADFQCPACKTYWSQVTQLKETYGDRVAVVYRQFPLTSIHNYAFDASKASEAAALQGKFFEYHDLLYRNQSDNTNPLTEENYLAYAEELGLDVQKFREDFESNEVRQAVQEDVDFGLSIGVNSTPTFFIDGEKFEGGDLVSEVESRLQSEEQNEQTTEEVEVETGEQTQE